MAEEQGQDKKIIVDEDWKKEAQREKDVLAAKEEQEKKEQAEHPEQPRGPLPKGDLAALISMLATQAMFALGVIRVKGQEDKEPDLEMARYNIDMLETLAEKTKGNLSEAEDRILKNTLGDLRMGFVQISEHGAPKAPSE